jgi:hypothetical protein
MISVRCILCLQKSLESLEKIAEKENWSNEKLEEDKEKIINNTSYEITSKLITKTEMEGMQALGIELAEHLKAVHRNELERLAILQIHFNGFNVMKFFETKDEDSLFEREKEQMREKLLEEVMMFALEDDDDEEFEDEDQEDLFSDELDDEEEEEDELLAKKE